MRVLGPKANELLIFDAVKLDNKGQDRPAYPLTVNFAGIGTGSSIAIGKEFPQPQAIISPLVI